MQRENRYCKQCHLCSKTSRVNMVWCHSTWMPNIPCSVTSTCAKLQVDAVHLIILVECYIKIYY